MPRVWARSMVVKLIVWIKFLAVSSWSMTAISAASSRVIVFNSVASFQRPLQASYIARSVVTSSAWAASTINCLPLLVTNGKSADASRRNFNAFPCLRVLVWLIIQGLACRLCVPSLFRVFLLGLFAPVLLGVRRELFLLFGLR